MAVIEYDSYKQKLLAMSDTFENLQKALDIESSKHEIARLEAEAHEDGFWNDIERSQANQMRTKQLQNKVHRFEKLVSTRDDLLALIDMGNEMDDASLLPELEEGFADLADFFEGLAAIEKSHENRYQLLIARIENDEVFRRKEVKVWYCTVCGHIEIGTEPPEKCPVCEHPQGYFEIKADNF